MCETRYNLFINAFGKGKKMKNIVSLSLILWLAAAAPLPAAIILVQSQYTTIQAGINAANNGDTVIIAPGTYMGPGNREISFMGKAITVRSTDPNDPNTVATTIVDCAPIDGWDEGGYVGFRFTNNEDTNSVLDGITITNAQKAHPYGGGIMCEQSAPTIKNCIIRNCSARSGGGIYCYQGQSPDGYSYKYPQIINCTISNNTATQNGGGIYCDGSRPVITNCTISNNTAVKYLSYNTTGNGGAIYAENNSMPIVTNCTISGNSAGSNGGGICQGTVTDNSTVTIINCLIIGNSATFYGGGICGFSTLNVSNCTVVANSAGQPGQTFPIGCGGGICYSSRNPPAISVINSIFWGNWDYNAIGETDQIAVAVPADPRYPPYIAFNCIQDYDPNDNSIQFNDDPANQNIDDNPKFVRDPNIADSNFGDLHLQKDSPCINTGLPNYIAGTGVDMDGQSRVIGTRIDMGADEYTPIIAVTNPKGGEVWAGTSRHEIKWDSFGVSGIVTISYSTNGGANWRQIGTSDVGTGSFLWQVPNGIDSNQCLISVAPGIPDDNVAVISSRIFSINSFKPWLGKQPNAKAAPKTGPKQACVKWQFETGGPVTAAVTAQNNKAYIACEDGKLYVLDANSGSFLWSYDAKASLTASAGVSHNGMVYAADSQGKLHALNKQGQLQWTQNTYGPIHSTPVVARNSNIYLCSEDGTLYALGQDGSELWCFDTAGIGLLGGSILATPQIGADETIYLAGLYDPNLYAVNPADGSIKWICNFGPANGWPFAAPAIAEDGVLYQTLLYDSNMYAIEPQDGQIIWSANIADPCSGLFEPVTWTDSKGTHSSFEYLKYSCGWSPPVTGPDGTIYLNVANVYLEAVNPDGTIKWAKKIGDVGGLTLTVDKKGLIYAASDDKHLYIVDPTGKVISEFTGEGWLSWPVVSKDRMLTVSDANNVVWALSDEACGSQTPVNTNQSGKK